MAVASIVCVDGELDVHDTASASVKAALERHREAPNAKIGVAVGDLEIGDPLGFAKRLCELAEPGAILVSDTVRRAVARDTYRFVDLGAVSTGGYLDRIHVFDLGGSTYGARTVLALDFRVADVEAESLEHDRRIWATLGKHRGFVARALAGNYLSAFELPADALRAAVAIIRDLTPRNIRVEAGLERGRLDYAADRWTGDAWLTAERIRDPFAGQLASTMTVVEALGPGGLAALGLVIEVVEEVVQHGVRDPVRVARLRIA